ncbi:Cytochrome c oxidase assembly protein cox11, mitochondrial [Boothiomyces sp. JEL0866]|nr:Cytochrome c oxidase assembly protein cox11, mitochondrial [Boothiomyces sp. JEL0866]
MFRLIRPISTCGIFIKKPLLQPRLYSSRIHPDRGTTTGYDGTPKTGAGTKFDLKELSPTKYARPIKIHFDSSVSDEMPWSFTPEVKRITAKNPTKEDIIGISTYSVIPYKAAQYFNKIQCFCFEEQMLQAGDEIDMPVFFFIDPEFSTDPWMKDVEEITLHYTFFKSKNQELK